MRWPHLDWGKSVESDLNFINLPHRINAEMNYVEES